MQRFADEATERAALAKTSVTRAQAAQQYCLTQQEVNGHQAPLTRAKLLTTAVLKYGSYVALVDERTAREQKRAKALAKRSAAAAQKAREEESARRAEEARKREEAIAAFPGLLAEWEARQTVEHKRWAPRQPWISILVQAARRPPAGARMAGRKGKRGKWSKGAGSQQTVDSTDSAADFVSLLSDRRLVKCVEWRLASVFGVNVGLFLGPVDDSPDPRPCTPPGYYSEASDESADGYSYNSDSDSDGYGGYGGYGRGYGGFGYGRGACWSCGEYGHYAADCWY